MRLLVFEHKVVSMEYFMDTMQLYELTDALNYLQYTDKNILIANRYTAYVVCQIMSKKHMKPSDMYSLPWDNKHTELTDEAHNKAQRDLKVLEGLLNKNMNNKT